MSSRQLLIVVLVVWSCANSDKAANGQPVPPPNEFLPRAKERAIETRLLQPITLRFKEVPLQQAIKVISAESGVIMLADVAALREAGVKLDAPVSGEYENIAMKSALNLLLRPMRLRYIIEDDVLKIAPEGRRRIVRRSYEVGDLVVPLALFEGRDQGQTKDGELVKLIQNIVARDTWQHLDGRTIQYRALDRTLQVTHDEECHEEIEQLLASLRKLQDLTIQVDLRLVQASSATARQWRKAMTQDGKTVATVRVVERDPAMGFVNRPEANCIPDAPGKQPRTFAALQEKCAQQLLDLTKGDRATKIVQAPKINIFNGESVPLEFAHKEKSLLEVRSSARRVDLTTQDLKVVNRGQTIELSATEKFVSGWRCTVLPVVSPDRRSVRTTLAAEYFTNDETTSVVRTLKAAQTFVLLDGDTLVWDLGELAGEHLLVMVTPRVRDRSEERAAVRAMQTAPMRAP